MSRSRVAAVAVAALVFVAFTLVSGRLPAFAFRADVIVSMAIGVALVGIMVGAVVTARPSPRQALVVAGAGLACAVVGAVLGGMLFLVFPVAGLIGGAVVGGLIGRSVSPTPT